MMRNKIFYWPPDIIAYAPSEEEARQLVIMDIQTRYQFSPWLAEETFQTYTRNRKVRIYEMPAGIAIACGSPYS